MRKRLFSLLTAAAMALTAAAAPVDERTAAGTACRFWRQALGQTAPLTAVDLGTCGVDNEIYVFVAKERGFVIVGGDEVALPILAYSVDEVFDAERLPLQLKEWIGQWRQQIAWAREAGHSGTKVATGTAQAALKNRPAVGPLITTLWDQYTPYNGQCPTGTVTGCAATAQAMLMKYWNHPFFGEGSHSYVHSTYGTLGADFAHTVYDWAHMPDSVTTASGNREQAAVATLMYHVGVSLDMVYSTPQQGGSAAAGLAGMPGYASMDNSLKDYFRYSPRMRVVTKGMGFTDDTWRDTLMAELDLGHPILYTGSSAQGGHGFVCDGYDSLGMMHFNFGWSGIGNGYYAVGSITPGIGPDGSLGSYDFSSGNQALLGAVPVYGICASDTVKAFTREGGRDSLLFSIDPTLADTAWTATSDAAWLTVRHDGFSRVGWVYVEATENTTGRQRVATVTFGQGDERITLRVLQDHYGEDEYCPLTVVMESRRGNGWIGGANLTLESEGGQVFGTARLSGGASDSVVIAVSPLPLHIVWHSGGGTDRFANYTVKDPSGNVLLHVENAYLNDDRHVVDNPCGQPGVGDMDRVPEAGIRLFPNPTTGIVNIEGEMVETVVVRDGEGRVVAHYDGARSVDLRQLPQGNYLLTVQHGNSRATYRVTLVK